MPAAALKAIGRAASSCADLNELHEKPGAWLVRRIGVEAAFVSAGAASGMQLAAAACLTGTDGARVRALPRTDGWRNEFVIASVDPHFHIHQGIEPCGGRLVRAGTDKGVTTEQILSAVGRTPLQWCTVSAGSPGSSSPRCRPDRRGRRARCGGQSM